MTESLYRITLAYLRKNRHLINFTKLDYQASDDMFKVIENPAHLSTVTICRRVYNWKALYCYIVKYYKNTKYVFEKSRREYSWYDIKIIKEYGENFIDDLYIDSEWVIFEVSTKSNYKIKNIKAKKYKVINEEFIKNNAQLFPRNMKNILIDDCDFSKISDAITPATQCGYISERIFIYNNMFKKYDD